MKYRWLITVFIPTTYWYILRVYVSDDPFSEQPQDLQKLDHNICKGV